MIMILVYGVAMVAVALLLSAMVTVPMVLLVEYLARRRRNARIADPNVWQKRGTTR